MSEYWKSTPKYWCKHCKTHVRDTPLERRNHESTPKHQGALSRFLQDLHRTKEREARDVRRAKEEAARLNGLATSNPSVPSSASAFKPPSGGIAQTKATPEDRQRQLSQLAALGVAVPEEFRRDNAMAGEWESLPQEPTVVFPPRTSLEIKFKAELGESEDIASDNLEINEANSVASEPKKRTISESEDEHKALRRKKRPNWGNDVRAYTSGKDDELEVLLDSTKIMKKPPKEDESPSERPSSIGAENGKLIQEHTESRISTKVRKTNEYTLSEEADDLGSIFKKRKPKAK